MFRSRSSRTDEAPPISHRWATVAAPTGDHSFIARNNAEYEARRNLVVSLSAEIDGLSSAPPQGAFFSLISCGAYLGKKAPNGTVTATDDQLVDYLLNEFGVATRSLAPRSASPAISASRSPHRKRTSRPHSSASAALAGLS